MIGYAGQLSIAEHPADRQSLVVHPSRLMYYVFRTFHHMLCSPSIPSYCHARTCFGKPVISKAQFDVLQESV